MANITTEIKNFLSAIYGKDVRAALVSLAEKLNLEVENNTTNAEQAAQNANNSALYAEEATRQATAAASSAAAAAEAASEAANEAGLATENANAAAAQLDELGEVINNARDATTTANEAAERAAEAAENIEGELGELRSDFTELEDALTKHKEAINPILLSTNNNADRSADIMSKLSTYGACVLGKGTFYISSGIDMPDNSILSGLGNESVLQLMDSSDSTYAVKLGSYCNVENLYIKGNSTKLPGSTYTQGSRAGILLIDTATTSTTIGDSKQIAKVNNVTITDFNNSGIRCYRSGAVGGILGNNIDILRCHTGINIELLSEFNAFSNVRVKNANVGCLMNAGNNLFTNCFFTSCLTLIKSAEGSETLVNDSHSSFVGCSLAHSEDNQGWALDLNNVHYGLVFTGCNICYGKIKTNWCVGVQICNNNIIGCDELYVNQSKGTHINNNIFNVEPIYTITNSPTFQFYGNTLKTGEQLTSSDSMKTSEETAVEDLFNKINQVAFKAYAIPANSAKTFTFAKTTNQALLICCGAYNEAKGIAMVSTNSSGTLHNPLTFFGISGVIITKSENTLLVTNDTSSSLAITYMKLIGDIPTMT